VRKGAHLVAFLCLFGCSSRKQIEDVAWTPAATTDLGAVVARVGGIPVFASQVLAEARRSGKSPAEALDQLVEANLLAEVARGRGFPESRLGGRDLDNVLVQRFLEKELEPGLRADAIPDSVLKPLYDRGRDSFVHPRLVEVAVLAVYTGSLMKETPRLERANLAQELVALFEKRKPKTLDEFLAVAKDPVWAGRPVTTDRIVQGLDQPLTRKIGIEIAKLHSVGDTTPLLSDENGFFIARYISERPPENITFEQIRGKLATGYFERWRAQQFLDFTGKLMSSYKVEAHFDRLGIDEQKL
jgi:hypothetical protein